MNKLFKAIAATAAIAAGLGFSSVANATIKLYLQANGGAITEVNSSATNSVSYSGTFSGFLISAFFNGVQTNDPILSQLQSSAVRVENTTNVPATLTLWVSADGYTLPLGPQIIFESSAGGSNTRATTAVQYQAWADANNGLRTIAGPGVYDNGLQNAIFTASSFDTGSKSGLFTRGPGAYSATSALTLVFGAGGIANYSAQLNLRRVPEPASLALIGIALAGVGLLSLRRKQ